MYDGEGKLYINDYLYYSGLFKLGQQNGSGKLYKNNKIVFDGTYIIIVKIWVQKLNIIIVIIYYITVNYNDLRNGFGTTIDLIIIFYIRDNGLII